MNKSMLRLSILIVALLGGVAISKKLEHHKVAKVENLHVEKSSDQPTIQQERKLAVLLPADTIKVDGEKSRASNPDIHRIDEKIDISNREIRDLQNWYDSNQIKDQLNSASLPRSTRQVYFQNLERLAELRLSVIRLRIEKIESLEASAKQNQSKGNAS